MRVSSNLVAVNSDSLDHVRVFGFFCNFSLIDPFPKSVFERPVCLYDLPLRAFPGYFRIIIGNPLPCLCWLGIACPTRWLPLRPSSL